LFLPQTAITTRQQERGYLDSVVSAYQSMLSMSPEHSEARKSLQTLRLQSNSKSGETYYRQGNQYRQAGNLEAAATTYPKALERAPDNADILNSLSVT
jgi:tetratricopeptide (TPR) repeat protein